MILVSVAENPSLIPLLSPDGPDLDTGLLSCSSLICSKLSLGVNIELEFWPPEEVPCNYYSCYLALLLRGVASARGSRTWHRTSPLTTM